MLAGMPTGPGWLSNAESSASSDTVSRAAGGPGGQLAPRELTNSCFWVRVLTGLRLPSSVLAEAIFFLSACWSGTADYFNVRNYTENWWILVSVPALGAVAFE